VAVILLFAFCCAALAHPYISTHICISPRIHTLGALAYAQCQKLLHTLRKLTAFPFLARTQDGCVISSSHFPPSPRKTRLRSSTCIHIYNFNDFIFTENTFFFDSSFPKINFIEKYLKLFFLQIFTVQFGSCSERK